MRSSDLYQESMWHFYRQFEKHFAQHYNLQHSDLYFICIKFGVLVLTISGEFFRYNLNGNTPVRTRWLWWNPVVTESAQHFELAKRKLNINFYLTKLNFNLYKCVTGWLQKVSWRTAKGCQKDFLIKTSPTNTEKNKLKTWA